MPMALYVPHAAVLLHIGLSAQIQQHTQGHTAIRHAGVGEGRLYHRKSETPARALCHNIECSFHSEDHDVGNRAAPCRHVGVELSRHAALSSYQRHRIFLVSAVALPHILHDIYCGENEGEDKRFTPHLMSYNGKHSESRDRFTRTGQRTLQRRVLRGGLHVPQTYA